MSRTIALTIEFDRELTEAQIENAEHAFAEQVEEILTGKVDGDPWGYGKARVVAVKA